MPRPAMIAAIALCLGRVAVAQSGGSASSQVVVEGDAIGHPLSDAGADAARGRAIVLDPERGNCTICHALPGSDARLQGNIGPSLTGIAGRLSPGQIRLRLVDGTRLNPASVMPPYYRIDGLARVAAPYRGRPVLSAGEIEDVLAYLLTLNP